MLPDAHLALERQALKPHPRVAVLPVPIPVSAFISGARVGAAAQRHPLDAHEHTRDALHARERALRAEYDLTAGGGA